MDTRRSPEQLTRKWIRVGRRLFRAHGHCAGLFAALTLTAMIGCTPVPPVEDPCAAPGVICSVAGTGQSLFDGDGKLALETSFYYPLDIEFDAQQRPLILDFNNLRLRRLNPDGRIETIMGLDYEDFPQDGALAIDTPLHHPSDIEFDAQGRLYVAGDHVPVVFLVGLDQRVQTVAGTDEFGYAGDGGSAREATLIKPFGVLPDDRGGFYISDLEAHVVRYVDSSGIIQTVAGDGMPGYLGDDGPGTHAQLSGPTRMRLDDTGRLFICDTDNHAIRRLDPDGVIVTIVGNGTPGYSGDGGPAFAALLDSPYDVRFSPSGELYIADAGNSVIRRIDTQGVITTIAGDGIAGFAGDGAHFSQCRLNRPSALNFDEAGAMWIADAYNHRVRKISGYLSPPGE